MNSILFFALVLAVAGGAIAYIGDRLGTYVGKRRMSVIGLRPRHTAMLYTIFSGSAIAVLTLLALVASDQAFRRALVEGPHLIYENNQYRRQIKVDQRTAAADLERAQQATEKLTLVQSQLQPVQDQLASVKKALGRSRQALQERQGQLAQAVSQLTGVRTSLDATNDKLRTARRDVQTANQALADARQRVRLAEADVRQQQTRVRDLTAQQSRLKTRIEASSAALIYRTDQEVGRVVIKTSQPVNSIEAQLQSYLADLSRDAEQRGGGHPGNGRAVGIAVPAPQGGYLPLDVAEEKQAVRTLAQNIAAGSGGSVVVIARAVNNTFLGEQTSIALYPYDNVLIYPKNAVVASWTINGAATDAQVFEDWKRFLTEQVQPAVVHQGLIPESDPQTGKPVLGAIDRTTWLAVVQEIEQIGADARVTAYVGDDTYSSGPLDLRFSVAPVAAVAPPSPAPRPSPGVGAAGGRS